ncbi:MAG: Wzz/FepE/Etk N-terminal domain-containing protein, partial [Candidatus Acidiferrales bacterium]
MIWKQKWLILIIFVVLTATSIAIVQKLPPVYEAAAVILVDSQKIPSNMVPSTVTAGLQDRLANLAQQIFSSNRLQA